MSLCSRNILTISGQIRGVRTAKICRTGATPVTKDADNAANVHRIIVLALATYYSKSVIRSCYECLEEGW